jgi:hypothetical protein
MMSQEVSRPGVWEGTVLTVPNRHFECCGEPPDLNAEDGYTAYFENGYGEQLVFQYDYKSKKGALWHGDCGWDEPFPVMGGGTTVIMSKEEREWLQLVWQVATRGETKEFQLRSTLDLVNAYKAIYDGLLSRPEFTGDAFMQRSFSRHKKKLEKQAMALICQLTEMQIKDTTKEEGR